MLIRCHVSVKLGYLVYLIILWTVRILYTINSSPQYILARSHRKIPVSVVRRQQTPSFHYASTLPLQEETPSASQSEPEGLYATASLKACLDTICCSRYALVFRKDFVT